MNITAVLSTLKDVAGIAGSFVFTDSGQVLAREMHPMFDDVALGEASERLTRFRDTFAAVGEQLDLAVIRFQDHRLYLKVVNGGMLCILADGVVNMAALRMAANLVALRLAGDLDRRAGAGVAVAAPAPSPISPSGGTVRWGRPLGPLLGSHSVNPLFVESPDTESAAAMTPPVGKVVATRRFRGRTVG